MKRPIAISLSPNVETIDVVAALRGIFTPWRAITGPSIRLLEQWFRQYFSVSTAVSFVSGRCAMLGILQAVDIKKGDEVIVQAFTCVAVVNPILDLLVVPIYVDINNTLTMDPMDLEKKITKKTKAIIVQHTFGNPADIDKILHIARKYKLPVIEDCAHTIGGTDAGRQNKKLGTFGSAAFFSFGRDKAFSSVFGGMAITNNRILGEKLRIIQKQQAFPSFFWTLQQLFHPVAFALILPMYTFSFGKLLLVVFQKLHLLSFPVSQNEKKGKIPSVTVKKMPNALATLALLQLKRIHEFNEQRIVCVKKYKKAFPASQLSLTQNNPLLRFPLLSKKRDLILTAAKKEHMYLGNWYANIIDPKGVDFAAIYYKKGSCPKAEAIAEQIVNLPVYPTLKDEEIEKVIQLVKKYQ